MRNEEIKKHYSLKILFGPMFGCELNLPADDYFLIVNPSLALMYENAELGSDHDHAAHYATNTLYIPCDIVSPNITLHLSTPLTNMEQMDFNIEIHDEKGNCVKSAFKKNDIFIHEHIKLAVKCSEDEWSTDIQNYNLNHLQSTSSFDITQQRLINKKKSVILLTSLVFFVFISLLSISIYSNISDDKQVTDLNEILSGSPVPLDIVKGRDDKFIYVLAHNSQEMEWAKKATHQLKDIKNLIPVLLSKSKKDIISELHHIDYPVLQLDYSVPTHPVLSLYRSLSTSEEKKIKDIISKRIPFSRDVKFLIKTREELLNDARQGLDRLNIHYRQINITNGHSLVIRDALSDNVLNTLRDFIHKFNQQWGSTVITFSINLDEDWLQNKSYVDSSSGYLFLNPRHWYFPINNKDF